MIGKACADSTPTGFLNRRRGDFSDRHPHRQSPGKQVLTEIICSSHQPETHDTPGYLCCPHRNPITNWNNSPRHGQKWRRAGSNRQPRACKARALPVELRPRTPWIVSAGKYAIQCWHLQSLQQQRNYTLSVGVHGVEPWTSSLSATRSNQLSYTPVSWSSYCRSGSPAVKRGPR